MWGSSGKDPARELHAHGEEEKKHILDETGAPNDPEVGNGNQVPPVSPLLKEAKKAVEQEQGNRSLSDPGPVEVSPWELFISYSTIGLALAIALPFLLLLVYDLHIPRLEQAVALVGCDNTSQKKVYGLPSPQDYYLAPLACKWVPYHKLSPHIGLIFSTVVAGVCTAVSLICGVGEEVDHYRVDVSNGCCARRRKGVPKPEPWRCNKICGVFVFLIAFILLVLAAWGGCSALKGLASSEYTACQVACHLEVRTPSTVPDPAFHACSGSYCTGVASSEYAACQVACHAWVTDFTHKDFLNYSFQNCSQKTCKAPSQPSLQASGLDTLSASNFQSILHEYTWCRMNCALEVGAGEPSELFQEYIQQDALKWFGGTTNSSEYTTWEAERELFIQAHVQPYLQKHSNFLQVCLENNMVINSSLSEADWWYNTKTEEHDSRLADISANMSRAKYMDACSRRLQQNHSEFVKVMLRHQYNFTAFAGLWLQFHHIDGREIYGPPCGVAWLIIIIASRLTLWRKLTSLKVSKNLFLKEKLAGNITEHVWLFSHMYSTQGMRIDDIRRTWIVRNLKEADPAWEPEGPPMPEWLTVQVFTKAPEVPQGAKSMSSEVQKDAAEANGGKTEAESSSSSSSSGSSSVEECEGKQGTSSTTSVSTTEEEYRRRPKAGDRVKVEYQAFWVRHKADRHLDDWLEVKEGWEPVSGDQQRLTFTVEDNEVIKAFDKGVQKMRLPSGVQGQRSRTYDRATFTVDLNTACSEEVTSDDVGFEPTKHRESYDAMVYKVILSHGTPKEEEDRDANGFVDSDETFSIRSLRPEFIPAACWSCCFALGFAMVPGMVWVQNVEAASDDDWYFSDRKKAIEVLWFNTAVIFITNGLVFFGFVRAYFALQSKLQTVVAFDCMWQFPEEHPLESVEDSSGRPLLYNIEGWLQVLEAVGRREQGEPALSQNALLTRDTQAWKDTMTSLLDHNGYRASFTRQAIEDSDVLKANVDKLDEWFSMRRFLQLDTYDERVSLELATVVILLTLVPEVIVMVLDFLVGVDKVENFLEANILSLWNLIFSLYFVFRYLTVSRKFNDAFERHATQLAALQFLVQRREAKTKQDEKATEKEAKRIGDLIEFMEKSKSASAARFIGFEVNSNVVNGYLVSAGAWVSTQVWTILDGLVKDAEGNMFNSTAT